MLRHERRLIGLFLPIALVGLLTVASSAFGQKVRRDDIVFTPPNLNLLAEPQVMTVCEGGPAIVHLNARATSSYPIRYRWTTNAGRIQGDGPTVTWDLSGLTPGYYRAYVDIDTGSGDAACQAFSSTSVLVNPCPPPPPPVCPSVAIECPDRVEPDQPLTFRSTVTSGSGNVSPIYNWTVSAGRIIDGQGTNTIHVDTVGLAGQTVTATLSMGGYKLDCSATCSVRFPPPLDCKKFDEFPDIARNDEKARLDNFGIELQNDPTATGYVIVYPGQRGGPGDVQKHSTRVVDYLVNSRGINGQRIVTLVGPARDELLVELWLCPQGARPPSR